MKDVASDDFSGVHGPTELGAPTMSMNFGPLNRDGGWRRLNVAVTRARQEMILFTSFDSSMIDLNRTSARAVRDLKHFIEFAERGPRALAEAIQGSVGGYESPFEEAVAVALTRKGWMVVPQIGVSRFRIDLAIVHPDRPGDYLVGVECDGAAYHSAATARDRDKVRAAILTGLNWKLLRVWSTDWWVDKAGATERLHLAIESILEQSRQAIEEPMVVVAELAEPPGANEIETIHQIELTEDSTSKPAISLNTPRDIEPQRIAELVKPSHLAGVSTRYRLTDFTLLRPVIEPQAFYETAYNKNLLEIIRHVLEHEAPISESLLVQRVARAHGFQRAGRIIRERVMALTKRHHHVARGAGGAIFVWRDRETRLGWCFYRSPSTDEDIRQIEEIAPEELRAAADACGSGEREVEIARLFGVRRLSNTARRIIRKAIS